MPSRSSTSPTMSADVARGWRADMATLPLPTDDQGRWELLRAAEELKAAAAALQARVTVAFEASQRTAQEAAGVDPRDVGRGIAAQVARARRASPARGARDLGLARALVHELPHTLEALSHGTTTEWRATLVTRETACLTREDRAAVDAELAARPGGLEPMGDLDVERTTRAIGQRLDPYAATRRAHRAETDRRVTLRPAPDTMSRLNALLPVRHGVAVLASLTRHADSLRSTGDSRSRGQIMADTLVERVTGHTTANAVPVEVQLVITADSLLDDPHRTPNVHGDHGDHGDRGDHGDGGDRCEEPAWVTGYGPVPAPLARSWIRDTPAQVWLRRLFTHPATGTLAAMDSRRRTFTGQLRELVIARDRVCRTPWCDAPIRHVDHIQRATDGGPTNAYNAQGLCAACNLAREAPGWHTTGTAHRVTTTPPTGHHTTTQPPRHGPPPPRPDPLQPRSRTDYQLRDLVLSA